MRPAALLKQSFFAVTFACLSLLWVSCSQPDPQAERQRAIAEVFAKWKSCAPAGETESDVKLAITSVTRQPNETSVRLVAYALDKSAEFDAPAYLLSRGRWLINEKGRAYLLDEQCREYKLKDRKSGAGKEIPADGRIKLESGQAVEITLNFPQLPDDVRMGLLVYGNQIFPFSLGLSPAAR
jgi:hypothetical protein